jgi:hypothetical protein
VERSGQGPIFVAKTASGTTRLTGVAPARDGIIMTSMRRLSGRWAGGQVDNLIGTAGLICIMYTKKKLRPRPEFATRRDP